VQVGSPFEFTLFEGLATKKGPALYVSVVVAFVRVPLAGVAALAEFATRFDDLLTLIISDPNTAATTKSAERVRRCLRRDDK
jgi:hypothetical protein